MLNEFWKACHKTARHYLKNFTGYCYDWRDFHAAGMKYIYWLQHNPEEIIQFNKSLVSHWKEWQEEFATIFFDRKSDNLFEGKNIPVKKDKRFYGVEWNRFPYYQFLYKSHLLNEKFFRERIDNTHLPYKTKRKLLFYAKFVLDAIAPSNFLLTNPEAQRIAFESAGESLVRGWRNLLGDLSKLDITQTDESAFEVGKNLAITNGNVVFQNELIELIHYSPESEKTHKIPLLIIPPWINKFYILDLQPQNSLVRFLTKKGIDTYIISWKNPDHDAGKINFDDYVEKGSLKAMELVSEICGEKKINTLGYCLGGTLLAVTASLLERKNKNFQINSLSFLAAMIDFTDIGPMGDVIDKALVKKIERGELLINHGVMHGKYMEAGFNLIRANDLIWYYVVNNYLEGKMPKPFDVLFWTNDNTNLPAEMFIFYMNKMILENQLSKKNALIICNEPIDIGLISAPVCAIGFCEDHISPAKTVFETMKLVSGKKKFILGMSGHVMGVVNPPGKSKYGYFINEKKETDFEVWKNSATRINDSWWNEWLKFIKEYSGPEVLISDKFQNKKYPPLYPAPGKYVLEKCGDL